MGIAQGKAGILAVKRKFVFKNVSEHYRFHRREGKYGTEDRLKTNYKASFFYGTHETQLLKGEAELHKHFIGCKKNPGHKKFIPVDEFNINHLPKGHQDNDIVELVKTAADLTVRVAVTMTSKERPKFWPHTNEPYPFSDVEGSDACRLGSGIVYRIIKRAQKDNKESCPCKKCKNSDTPSHVWGKVLIDTASHVVFDYIEVRHTTFRLFYDKADSPLVSLDGANVVYANMEEDRCRLECVTCDKDLLDQLDKTLRHWYYLWRNVFNKYKNSIDKTKLTFIVSHPHGCPKQVSIGHRINSYAMGDRKTKYTYTTCTCPGSSGAHVHPLGYNTWFYYGRHVHSGVNSKGINFSGTGPD